MKVMISADYHLKLNVKNIPNEWTINRFNKLFEQLHSLEKEVELHLILGDFFDRIPTLEELELYYDFVSHANIETIIISGNHESLKKNTTFLSYLKNITSRLNPLVRIIDDFYTYKRIDFIPYNKLKEFEKGTKYTFNNQILATHCRGGIEPYVRPEIDLSLFDKWQTVLAGDLHSYDNCQRNILYPGSPITTTFHRNRVETGVIIFNTEDHSHKFVSLDLPQLIRKTIQAGEPMLPTEFDHTVYEVEGDMAELAYIEDTSLLDKKVTKRSNDTALILNPEMSIEEEIMEYLSYILELPQETIEKVLSVYHDNIAKTNLV